MTYAMLRNKTLRVYSHHWQHVCHGSGWRLVSQPPASCEDSCGLVRLRSLATGQEQTVLWDTLQDWLADGTIQAERPIRTVRTVRTTGQAPAPKGDTP